MRSSCRIKAEIFHSPAQPTPLSRVRELAAHKLQPFHRHFAGGGSEYWTVDGIKIRFADHENQSSWHRTASYSFSDYGDITDEVIKELAKKIDYPETCKKTAFAMHVGLTVPKLKKILDAADEECYDEICENDEYPNTLTEVVLVAEALAALDAAGITVRHPIEQFSVSDEDYCGF